MATIRKLVDKFAITGGGRKVPGHPQVCASPEQTVVANHHRGWYRPCLQMRIRDYHPDDLAAVAELKRIVFSWRVNDSAEVRQRLLRDVLLDSPFGGKGLVLEDSSGLVRGFVFQTPRTLRWGTRRFSAILSTHLMVHPEARGIAGILLLKKVLSGPQDLTFGDSANAAAKAVFTALGGFAPWQYSLEWTVPVRPTRWAAGEVRGHRARLARGAFRPVLNTLDRLIAAKPQSLRLFERPVASNEAISLAADFSPDLVVPEMSSAQFTWLLERVERSIGDSVLRLTALETAEGQMIAVCARLVVRGGTSRVLLLRARERDTGSVLLHLAASARHEGATALQGRAHPGMAQALVGVGAVLKTGPLMLLATRDHDLRDALLAGRLAISQFDGEWPFIHLSR